MHRTQLILEERQYRALTTRARRENKSLSALVRQAVDGLLDFEQPLRKKHRLEDMRGIFQDSGKISGRDHDAVLYGQAGKTR